MEKQFFKKLSCGLVVASLALIAGVVIGSANNASNELFTKASDELAVTYSRSTGTFKNNGNNIYTTSATSSRGNISYLSCESYLSIDDGYVARFPGTDDSSYNSTVLTFSTENTGSTASSHYKFQFLESVSASISNNFDITWHIEQSFDAVNWVSVGNMAFSNKTASSTAIRGAKYLRITEPTKGSTLGYKVTSITLQYSCSEVDPYKTLSSIEVVSPKTEYNVDDSFVEPSVTAYYDGGESSASVSGATFSGYNMSVAGNQTVTASYTENGITKTTSYDIKVKGSEPTLSGQYKYTRTVYGGDTYNYFIDFDLMKYYIDSYYVYFTYSVGDNIVFTLDGSKAHTELSQFGNYKLFDDTHNTNTSVSYSIGTSISLKLYGSFQANTRVFTKVS